MDYLTDYLSHSATASVLSSASPRVLESVVSYGTSSSEIIGSVLLYLCSTLSAAGGVGTFLHLLFIVYDLIPFYITSFC